MQILNFSRFICILLSFFISKSFSYFEIALLFCINPFFFLDKQNKKNKLELIDENVVDINSPQENGISKSVSNVSKLNQRRKKDQSVLQAKLTTLAIQIGYAGIMGSCFYVLNWN